MIETNHLPEQRANLEAFIRYYEDGGKVPEGQEELWSFDGQTSFGIRKYSSSNPPPEGWLYKIRYCDVSGFCLCRYLVLGALDCAGFVSLLTSVFLIFLEFEVVSTQLLAQA